MNIFKKILKKDTTSIQTTFNEDDEGVGGEIDVSNTEETTSERE